MHECGWCVGGEGDSGVLQHVERQLHDLLYQRVLGCEKILVRNYYDLYVDAQGLPKVLLPVSGPHPPYRNRGETPRNRQKRCFEAVEGKRKSP